MAYTSYTPNASGASAGTADVDIPDDSELESSGIGAIDTPMEDIADRVAANYTAVNGYKLGYQRYGSAGSVLDTNLANTSLYTVQSGGSDASASLTGCLTDDEILVVVSFMLQTTATNKCEVKLYQNSPSNYTMNHFEIGVGNYTLVTLHGVTTLSSDGTATFVVKLQNDTSGAGVGSQVIGEMMWTLQRVRPL